MRLIVDLVICLNRLFGKFWKRELFFTTKVTKKKFNRLFVDLVNREKGLFGYLINLWQKN